jgi:hypothetical protein
MPFKRKSQSTPKPPKPPSEPKSWQAHAEQSSDTIFRKAIALAKRGDRASMALVMRALTPRSRTVTFRLPPIASAADLVPALEAVAQATAAGVISPDEAAAFCTIVAAYRSAFELGSLEQRLRELEELVKSRLTNE